MPISGRARTTEPPRRGGRERGYVLLSIAVILLIGLGLVALSRYNSNATRAAAQAGEADPRLERLRDALVNFVSVNAYLPCPADGAAGNGLPQPAGPTSNCTSPAGTVPWAALGLSRDEALDPYLTQVSYRVYSGPAGFTQADGASAAKCDRVRDAAYLPKRAAPDPITKVCANDRNTDPALFRAALDSRGLDVNDSGAIVKNVAFLLISHGVNRAGGYTLDQRMPLPSAGSDEYINTQAASPFVAKAVTADLAPSDPAYFDDRVLYMRIADLITRAGLDERDWPDPPPTPPSAAATFSRAAVTAAAIAAGATPQDNSTNIASLTVNGVSIAAAGGTGREISIVSGSSGEGIGAIRPLNNISGGYITTTGGEKITLGFSTPGTRLGLMLIDFGSVSGHAERAQLLFTKAGSAVATRTLSSCNTGSVLASYDIDAGTDFDAVEISAMSRNGSGTSSDFLVGGVAQCLAAASTCALASATAATACP